MDALIIGLFIFSLGYLLSLGRWFYHERKRQAARHISRPRLVASNPRAQHRANAGAGRCLLEGSPLSDAV